MVHLVCHKLVSHEHTKHARIRMCIACVAGNKLRQQAAARPLRFVFGSLDRYLFSIDRVFLNRTSVRSANLLMCDCLSQGCMFVDLRCLRAVGSQVDSDLRTTCV